MEVGGGSGVLRVKPRARGLLSKYFPPSLPGQSMGFAVEWRKASQGQCALETGKDELGRLWGWECR